MNSLKKLLIFLVHILQLKAYMLLKHFFENKMCRTPHFGGAGGRKSVKKCDALFERP